MTCPRLWEVEASRDGRLTGEPLEQFARHMAHCPTCAAEAARLEALGHALRDNAPSPLDDLALERLKSRTLARADAALMTPARPSRRATRTGLLLAALVMAVAAVAVSVRFRAAHAPPESAPHFKVVPVAQARWRAWRSDDVQHVKLDDGTLRISVSRQPGDPRLVVDVPDGVIEDRGTRFAVEVRAARTTGIRVEEGTVEFRRRGGSPLVLVAGTDWKASDAGPVRPPETPATSLPPAPQPHEPLVARSQGRTGPDPRGPPAAALKNDATTATNTHEPAPSASGATAEDLAYLRIVALMREGRSEEARVLARDYLQRFPHGFRRAEVQSIATPPRDD